MIASPLFTATILMLSGVALSASVPPLQNQSTSCAFSSRNYSVGDVWYPRLGQQGALHCVACVCQEGGKINCNTIHQCGGQECAGSNSATNECCIHCSKEAKAPPTSVITAPAAIAARSTLSESTSAVDVRDGGASSTGSTCLHSGNVYKHKERFTSTTVGLKPEHANQCVQCTCEAGMVMCQLRDCPKVECDNPIRTNDDCCPVCPDPAGRLDEMDNSPIIIQQQTDGGKMEDCISGGRYYLHGTSWHPVMGPFGPMDCVNCKCRSGKIECHRLECPTRPALNCERPVKVMGRCCPVCPLEGDNQVGAAATVSSSSPIARGSSRVTTNLRSNSSPSGRGQPSTLSMTKSASSSPQDYSLCLPSSEYEIIVYRAQGGGNSSEFVQYIFQRATKGQGIEHHLWMIQPSAVTYKVQDLTNDQSEALRQRFRFTLIGATTSRNMKRFTKREKKLKTKCLPPSEAGCSKKVRRLERSLVLKEVISRKGCLPLEVTAFL